LIAEPVEHSHTVAQLLLYSTLEKSGFQGRLVAIHHLSDIQARYEEYYKQSLFNEEFYREWLNEFVFRPPDQLPYVRSIIVIAYPHPHTRITFTWNGKSITVTIPPTYLNGDQDDQRLYDHLSGTLEPFGYHLAGALIPKKLLAVCSGLGYYGKNNLCYVEGMGSFIRLVAFYSDIPCKEDNWQEPRMLEACLRCNACGNRCPTGAISTDRFLLRAERCITYHNEKPGSVTFPAWLNPTWHNCFVGCLICQRTCPQNRDYLHNLEEGPTFSQEETAQLLKGLDIDQLPATLVDKLSYADLVKFLDIFSRNLRALLERDKETAR
jgi:epoxyqueuosine reductase